MDLSEKFVFQNVNLRAGKTLILQNICGYAAKGEILALMGPSGGGKTSLLNILSFRHELLGVKSNEVQSTIVLDGRRMNKHDKKNIGFVMQNDIFFNTVTLLETLRFYGSILLPREMKPSQKETHILELIEMFHLSHAHNTIIGGGLLRGLSGGERKRASIAVEMLNDPSLLFLDEPTSGLDSNLSMELLLVLKELAEKKGKIIISSIHQPSSQIFFTFDRLLLLAKGELMYFGAIPTVSSYFRQNNFPCPESWNIADHIITVVSEVKNIRPMAKAIREQEQIAHLQETLEFKESNMIHQEQEVRKSTYWTQLKSLTRRSFLRTAHETYTMTNFLRYFFIALITGVIFFQTPLDESNYTNFFGLLFYGSLQNFIDPLFTNIIQFMPESTVIRKERMSHMYRLSAYYFGKILGDSVIILLRPTLMWTFIYWMSGLAPSAYFLVSLILMYFIAFVGQAIGLFIASFGLDFMESVSITAVFLSLIMLLGGFFNKNLPYWLKWGIYISPIYYSYSLQAVIQLNEFHGVKCDPYTTDLTGKPASIFVSCQQNKSRTTPQELYPVLNITIAPGFYVLILICVVTTLYTSTYFVLRYTLSHPGKSKTLPERLKHYYGYIKKALTVK